MYRPSHIWIDTHPWGKGWAAYIHVGDAQVRLCDGKTNQDAYREASLILKELEKLAFSKIKS